VKHNITILVLLLLLTVLAGSAIRLGSNGNMGMKTLEISEETEDIGA